MSLLRAYQVYLLQKELKEEVITQPYEFIEAFKPEDLDFLREDYLFDITKDFKPVEYPPIEDIGIFSQDKSKQVESSSISDKGGIDFGAMPIVTQAVNSPQSMAFNPWNNFNTVSSGITSSSLKNALDSNNAEWLQIEKMVSSGIMPSPERIREYLITSCQDEQSMDRELNKVICCIAAITRLEERNAVVKSKWKELLSLMESNIPVSQLQLELKQLVFLPK